LRRALLQRSRPIPHRSGISSLVINTPSRGARFRSRRATRRAPLPYPLPEMARGGGSALTYNFDPHWGAEIDAGYSRDTQSASSEWTVSGGPRYMWRIDPGPNFFIHAQVAFNRVSYAAGQNDNNGIGAILGWRYRYSIYEDVRVAAESRPTTFMRATTTPAMPIRNFRTSGDPASKAPGSEPVSWLAGVARRQCLPRPHVPCNPPK
jgi:hypothetical protein